MVVTVAFRKNDLGVDVAVRRRVFGHCRIFPKPETLKSKAKVSHLNQGGLAVGSPYKGTLHRGVCFTICFFRTLNPNPVQGFRSIL